ncbi:MAG TPA: histidinol-phosphate transaminase [Thermoanaerobaculia bacterium]|nr:histidinol-phosphate transaminase [Thermoanaerobaculia bacterium]
MNEGITRRRFAGTVGAALGASLVRPAGAAAALAAAHRLPKEAIRLSANENPYGPSEKAREAIARSAAVGHRYPDDLTRRVRDAIARRHRVAPEEVLLGCGSSQILQMADAAYLGPGRKVVAAEPTFEAVLAYAAVLHAEPVKVPETPEFRHDLDRMAAACDASTGLVYVCNPNNPTGTVVGGRDLSRFLARVPQTTTVLVDEAYHDFVEDPGYRSALELLPEFPNAVVARTFSKIYGLAGMRLGYAVASADKIRALGEFASWDNVNAAALSAALASLEDPELVPSRRRTLNGTRRELCAELERDGRRYIPSQANFVMIDVGADVDPVIREFRERGIHVGRRFASMPNWLRVSIGTPEEMRAFLAAFREIVPGRRAA